MLAMTEPYVAIKIEFRVDRAGSTQAKGIDSCFKNGILLIFLAIRMKNRTNLGTMPAVSSIMMLLSKALEVIILGVRNGV